ncbi:nickel-dependent hydrogenase large subunit [Profundibacter sp.]|uniref:nickel-dependent hydrogenase large subunit n=1 Tax=Profundibacter sp. TaxID=3101071 RepID=UPI003D0C926C
MSLEGRLTIELRDARARIVSSRRTDLARLMVGRDAREAAELLPRLFSLCGEAHRAAAALALFGWASAAQMRLVTAESAREHLLRIALGWCASGEVPLPAAPVMALVEAARRGGDAAAALEDYLSAHVLGCAPDDFLSQREFHGWLGEADTRPARFLRAVLARGRAGLGMVEPAFLPALAPGRIAERLDDPAFLARPEWNGPRETGPLARQFNQPLVAGVIGKHGAGLLARMVARLVELAGLPEAIRVARPRQAASGFGTVETARGRLIHAARVEGGKVAAYAIVAPTEWNFHPEGMAARALAGLAPDEAGLVIKAIDPCVDYELRVA